MRRGRATSDDPSALKNLGAFFKQIGFTDSHTMEPLSMPFPRAQLRAAPR